MRVLIVPEDFRKDQYLVKPIIERLLEGMGVRAAVRVCADPLLGGVREALKWARIEPIILRYRSQYRIVIVVDRDGDLHRCTSLAALEEKAQALDPPFALITAQAIEEIETWTLAGLELPADWRFSDIRGDCNPKENWYLDLARRRGLLAGAAEGRETLGREAASSAGLRRMKTLCPELAELEQRLRTWAGRH